MRIRILSCSHDQTLPLSVNGMGHIVPVKGDGSEDGASEIPDAFLPALADSHVEYEIVVLRHDEAGEGAGGDSGEPPAEIEAVEPPVAPPVPVPAQPAPPAPPAAPKAPKAAKPRPAKSPRAKKAPAKKD